MASSKPMAKRRKAADTQQQALFAVQHQQTLEKIRKQFDKHPEKASEVHRMLVSAPYSWARHLLPRSSSWVARLFLCPSSAAISVHWANFSMKRSK